MNKEIIVKKLLDSKYPEKQAESVAEEGAITEDEKNRILDRIETRRADGIRRLDEINPKAVEVLEEHRNHILEVLKEKDPQLYESIKKHVNLQEK